MEIIYKKQFLKDLHKLPPKILNAVKAVLDELERAENFENARVDYVRMSGQAAGQNYYRIRVGNFRIGMSIEGDILTIMLISPRGDIYKKFPPQ